MEETTGESLPNVISVAAGESHTLALTGDGRVFSWGRALFGRLGTGSVSDELSPVELSFGTRINFVGVSAGAYHSLALADDGSVWSWGYNIHGQLGFEGDNSPTPVLLEDFVSDQFVLETESPLKICYVEAGGMTSAAVDDRGGLWIWGSYPGHSDETGFTPRLVRDFLGRSVWKLGCGNDHIVALVRAADGDMVAVYSWGDNKHGQLGLGDMENRARPDIVAGFEGAYDVACGGFHTALLASGVGSEPDFGCWTFGLGENGQLGHGTTLSSAVPRRVEKLPGEDRLVSVGCGLFHTSVASSSGGVWSWGMERGLGLCPDARVGAESGDAIVPLAVSGPKFENPVQVACGAAHTVLVACNGSKLWSWGRGRSGTLGTGRVVDCLSPTPVSWPKTTEKNPPLVIVEEKVSREEPKVSDLEKRLSSIERYASVLHHSIFGKAMDERDIARLVSGSDDFEAAKEWERMIETAGRGELVGLEMFYRRMLSGIEDQLMKMRIKEALKECLSSLRN